jgi:hypothetical protein
MTGNFQSKILKINSYVSTRAFRNMSVDSELSRKSLFKNSSNELHCHTLRAALFAKCCLHLHGVRARNEMVPPIQICSFAPCVVIDPYTCLQRIEWLEIFTFLNGVWRMFRSSGIRHDTLSCACTAKLSQWFSIAGCLTTMKY